MAISLNNINDRVTALEASLKGGIVQFTTLWSGSSASTVTLNDSVSNYDFIGVTMTMNDTGSQEIIPSAWYGRTLFTEYAYGGGMARISASGNKLNMISNYGNTTKFTMVTGIKVAKTLYYKVLESFNRFFKEVIS